MKWREWGAYLLDSKRIKPWLFRSCIVTYVPDLTEVKLEVTWHHYNGRFSLLFITCLFDPFSLPKVPDNLKILKCPRPKITYFAMRERLVYKRKDTGHIYNLCVLFKYISGHSKKPHHTTVREMDLGARLLVQRCALSFTSWVTSGKGLFSLCLSILICKMGVTIGSISWSYCEN